jgi:hypothetical protein
MSAKAANRLTKKYLDDRRNDLRSLAQILDGRGIVQTVDPLKEAAREIRGGDALDWKLHIRGLRFNVSKKGDLEAQRHAKPADLSSIRLQLDIKLTGRCLHARSHCDPFRRLSVECVATGRSAGDPAGRYHSVWHLERHDPEKSGADLAHPAYHLQYGGMRLPQLGWMGNHLLLDSPRVAHPPLDGVLAVDFVVSNYFPGLWRDLRRNVKAYKELVDQAQERYWRPYALASVARWTTNDDGWDGDEVWPQVVRRGRTEVGSD